jgi:ribosomal protein S18 acetylase RimI-like enzyme
MAAVEIRELAGGELACAAELVARAMRDDPMSAAVFGPDPARRLNRLHCFFAALLPGIGQAPLSAWQDTQLVGVFSYFPPGCCTLPFREQLKLACRMLSPHVTELWRLWHWLHAADVHTPGGRLCHLGPVAVDVGQQRRGIGGQMLQAFCDRMDREGETAFLETDKLGSVHFYARHGFEVVASAEVLGTRNWWMRRPPCGSG